MIGFLKLAGGERSAGPFFACWNSLLEAVFPCRFNVADLLEEKTSVDIQAPAKQNQTNQIRTNKTILTKDNQEPDSVAVFLKKILTNYTFANAREQDSCWQTISKFQRMHSVTIREDRGIVIRKISICRQNIKNATGIRWK